MQVFVENRNLSKSVTHYLITLVKGESKGRDRGGEPDKGARDNLLVLAAVYTTKAVT